MAEGAASRLWYLTCTSFVLCLCNALILQFEDEEEEDEGDVAEVMDTEDEEEEEEQDASGRTLQGTNADMQDGDEGGMLL